MTLLQVMEAQSNDQFLSHTQMWKTWEQGQDQIFNMWEDIRQGDEDPVIVRYTKQRCKEMLAEWDHEYKKRLRMGMYEQNPKVKIIRSKGHKRNFKREKERIENFWNYLKEERDSDQMKEFIENKLKEGLEKLDKLEEETKRKA